MLWMRLRYAGPFRDGNGTRPAANGENAPLHWPAPVVGRIRWSVREPTSSQPPRHQLSASLRISPAHDLVLTPRGVIGSLASPVSLIAAPFDRLLADDQGHRQATSECRNGVKHK